MRALFLTSLLGLAACVPQNGAVAIDDSRVDRPGAQDDTPVTPSTMVMTTSQVSVIQGSALPAVRFMGVRVPAAGQTTSATGVYDLAWEGEELQGSLAVLSGLDANVLHIGGQFIEDRIGESRGVAISLELDAASLVPGTMVTGNLMYGESPEDHPALDVLLGSTVEVEVALDPNDPTALMIDVPEVNLAPAWNVGVMRAGALYEGPYDLFLNDPSPQLDCGALTPGQLDFVSQDLTTLASEDNVTLDPVVYAGVTRGGQGQDPMQPFQFSSRLVNALSSFDATRTLQRVPGSGGLVEIEFRASAHIFSPSPAPMDLRAGPAVFEVARRLTIDARQWGPGFDVTVERFYADHPDAELEEATCTALFGATLQTFTNE